MRQLFSAVSFSFLICISSFVSAQETFTDLALWQDAICGTVTNEDFASLNVEIDETLVFLNGPELVPGVALTPQTFPFGTLDSDDSNINVFATADNDVDPVFEFALGDDNSVFNLDPANGNLEGFCFEYTGSPTITIFDGTTVIDTITPEPYLPGLIGPDAPVSIPICWLNSGQANVTSVEFEVNLDAPIAVAAFYSASFAFGDGCDPPADTCFSQLEDVIADLGLIGPTGNSCDDQLIASALWYLDCATHESLWLDDDHVQSCAFFYYARKATKYLTWVSSGNADVDQALEDIQSVLSCVAENEIAAAVAAGGDSCDIAWAEYYQDCADYYQSVGNYRKAAKYRKWAWVCASWAY